MAKEKFDIVELVNNCGCFDLQFRKDTRRERVNSPTYYRWKAQFVVTAPEENLKNLKKIRKKLGCGDIHISKAGQARFSVQKISDITGAVVPFCRRNALRGNKKKNFGLWAKGVEIIQKNKGKYLSGWKKNDLNCLMEIQKACQKYKNNPRKAKWLDMVKAL